MGGIYAKSTKRQNWPSIKVQADTGPVATHFCSLCEFAQRQHARCGYYPGCGRWFTLASLGSIAATKENQMNLKIWSIMGMLSLLLGIAGCTASQTPGPPGPQGPQGAAAQTGDSQRDEDRRRAEDQRIADEQRRAEEQRRADDKAREDRDSPCPAGQHLRTNPETGRPSCG